MLKCWLELLELLLLLLLPKHETLLPGQPLLRQAAAGQVDVILLAARACTCCGVAAAGCVLLFCC